MLDESTYNELRGLMLEWQQASVALAGMSFVPVTDLGAWDKMQGELTKRRIVFADAQAKLTSFMATLVKPE